SDDDPLLPLAIRALQRSRPSETADALLRFLESEEREVVLAVARLMAVWKVEGAAPRLSALGFAKHSTPIRAEIFQSLAILGSTGLKEVLNRAESSEGHMREAAAKALRHFPAATQQLLNLLESDPYDRVRMEASRSLQRIAGNEEDSKYFLPYDAAEAVQKAVIERWKKYQFKIPVKGLKSSSAQSEHAKAQ
ncbi:MAG: hypothetical protein QF886_23760, partial [Planctomycetota bacterium]|nr:hypothetical protein [Planctomycetota bacterium]